MAALPESLAYKRLAETLEPLVEPLYFCNARGVIEYANTAGKSLFGFHGDERRVLLFSDLVDTGHMSFEDMVSSIRSGKLANPVECRLKQVRKGDICYVSILPIKDNKGETKVFCTVSDSSYSNEGISCNIYKAVFDLSSDALFLLDGDTFAFIDINRKTEELSGFSKAELAGRRCDLLVDSEGRHFLESKINVLMQERSLLIDHARLLTKNGGKVPVEINSSVIDFNKRKLILSIVRDNSSRELYEIELKKRYDELSTLNYLSSIVNSTLDLGIVLDRSIQKVCNVTGMPIGCIFLYDKKTGLLVSSSYAGLCKDFIDSMYPTSVSECIEGQVAIEKKPKVIEDLPAYIYQKCNLPVEVGIRSVVSIPIMFRDQVLGVMDLASKEFRKFSDSDVNFFISIANTIGAGINNARFVQYIRSQAEMFSLLFKTTQDLTSTLDPGKVLTSFVKDVAVVARVGSCALFLFDEAGDLLYGKAAYGMDEKDILDKALKPEGKVDEAIRSKQPMVISGSSLEGRFLDIFYRKYNAGSLLCTPLVYKDRIIGAIFLFTRDKSPVFEQQLIDLMANLANQAAQAIENAMLMERMRRGNEELRRVYDIQRRITRSINLDETLDNIVKNVPYLLNLKYCVIFLIDPRQERITSIKSTYSIEKKFGELKFCMDELIATRIAIREKRPVVIEDAINFKDVSKAVVDLFGIRSGIVLPLEARGKILGAMWLYDTVGPRRFSVEDVRRAVALSDQVAISIDNAMLFKDLTKANRQLEDSYEKLKDLDNIKSEFFTLLSHELRTPLTTIKGFTELLRDGILGPVNDQQRNKLDRIAMSVDKLTDLVNTLSDISSIESKKYPIHRMPLSINEVISEVMRSVKFLTDSKGIAIRMDLPMNLPIVHADRAKITQVILNIVNNAIKYTPPGGEISIKTENRDADILVSIHDTGIGIPKKDLENIFSGFYHAGYKLSYEYKGPGLGLAISKGIIESHGGHIWAESELGKGSTFYFTLPKGVSTGQG